MSDIRERLSLARKKLVGVLGENEKAYWSNMKAWFKQKISKEDFDSEARRLLPKNETHLHNEFLLAVLTKCHIPNVSSSSKESSTSSSKMKKTKRLQAIKRKYDHRFSVNQANAMPSPPVANITKEAKSHRTAPAAVQQPLTTCTKTLLLPSMDDMRNYVSVIAWEVGLDDATEDVIIFATQAVRVFLKNILFAIFSRRSAYKTVNNSFKYAMGCEPENPYIQRKRSTQSLNYNANFSTTAKEQKLIEDLAHVAQDGPMNKNPVNMYDLQHMLKIYGAKIIRSHTVYALASERVAANLWHPDHDELKQDEVIQRIMQPTRF